MKFKAAVVSLLAAMLAVITVGMSMMVMEAKKQTEAAKDTAGLIGIEVEMIQKWSERDNEYVQSSFQHIMDEVTRTRYKYIYPTN